jgi:hypothetical protein
LGGGLLSLDPGDYNDYAYVKDCVMKKKDLLPSISTETPIEDGYDVHTSHYVVTPGRKKYTMHMSLSSMRVHGSGMLL